MYQIKSPSISVEYQVSKNYEPLPKPVSPYNDDLVREYLAQGLSIQSCSHGESGGLDPIVKLMMNPRKRKAIQYKLNQCRVA